MSMKLVYTFTARKATTEGDQKLIEENSDESPMEIRMLLSNR